MFKKIILAVLVLGSTLLASEVKWAKDYTSGMKEAVEKNRPVLLISSRHSCKYCVILKNKTLKDKGVIEALNRDFVSIIAYSDENDFMPRELFTPGVPAIWFLLPDSQVMFQPLMGAVDAPNFLNALTIVKETFDKHIATSKTDKKEKK